MSDVPRYGTKDKPFPELPPAGSLYSVNWGGSVRWPTAPFSYLEAGWPLLPPPDPDPDKPPPPNPRADSYTGTASFWFRINGSLDPARQDRIPIVYVAGPRVLETYEFEGQDHNIYTGNVADMGFFIELTTDPVSGALVVNATLHRMPGTVWYTFQVSSRNFFGEEPSFDGNIADNKWTHFLVTWDAEDVTGTIAVNTFDKPAYFTSLGTEVVDVSHDTSRPYAPIEVPWSETPRFFGALLTYTPTQPGSADIASIGPAEPLQSDHLISLAHVWVHTRDRITDPAMFVDAAGRPAKLGADYAITYQSRTIKPVFYFSGGVDPFLVNKGNGGETTLVGAKPTAQSAPVQIGR